MHGANDISLECFVNILFNISITLIFILEPYKGQTYRWQLIKGKIIVQYLL